MKRHDLQTYALVVVALALATLVRGLLDPWLGDYMPFPTYFAAVAVVGLIGTNGAALLTLVLGGLIADVLFMPPRGEFVVTDPALWVGLGLYVGSSLVIVLLAGLLRRSRRTLEINKLELQAQAARLREADERKDEFLSMLAHELRNPLAPIVSAVEVIRLSKMSEDASTRRPIEIIERQSKHLKYLVDDLLDLARINTGRIVLNRAPVEVGDVVREAAETAGLKCTTAGVRMEVRNDDEPLWVSADRGRLIQILDNLLDNACKFTGPGGTVTLAAHREDSTCVLTVRDTGAGIEPEVADRIFNVFEQGRAPLDRKSGGLGLGLHLVKRLVGKHDGTVSVRSEGAGLGSEFSVRLPLREHEIGDEAIAKAPRSRSMPRRVLVVDDNVDAAETLAMLLKADGHEVRVSPDGAHGVREAAEFRPEIAIVDLMMPGMDGYEVARALRDQFSDRIWLVAITGYGQEQYRKRSREVGFDAHLVKPVTSESIAEFMCGLPGAGSVTNQPAARCG